MPDPTVAELEADGFTHARGVCKGCGRISALPFRWIRNKLPKLRDKLSSMTLADLVARIRCERCKARIDTLTPWRQPAGDGIGPGNVHGWKG